MRTIEIVELTPAPDGGLAVCRMQEENGTKEITLHLDGPTYDSLHAVCSSGSRCRNRIAPVCEPIPGSTYMSGIVSVIHPRWVRRLSFQGSPSFFAQLSISTGHEAPDFSTTSMPDRQMTGAINGAHETVLERTTVQESTHLQRRYMPGLDGLRALSVLAVIAYHLNTRFAPGGFLCVTVFFVLSGYLITDMLTAEWAQHRKIDLKSFWIRRIRRLFPAMLAMIVAVIAWFALTDPGQLQLLRKEAVAAVLYVSNWWFIYHKVPYFEQFAAPDPFLHTWSLGIEEQFYLLWPLIVLFGMSRFRSRGRLTLMALSVAAVSMLVMAWLHQPGQDTSRIYYGTDTRAFSLLIGAALAFVWPSRTISQRVSALGGKLLDAGGALALGGILWAVWQWDEFKDWIYPGGMVALSLLSAVVVMAVAPSRSMLGSVLGWKPVAWIGRRSYGMYIWHYPLIVLAAPADYSGAGGAVQALIVLAACLTAGALSWTFIEQPMLQGVKRNLLKRTGRFAIALTGAFAIIMAQGSGLLEKGKAAFEAASSETSASETTRRDGVNEPIAGTGELIEHREVAVFSVASELLNQEGLTASSGSNTAAAPVKPAVGDASRTNAPPSPQDEADRANGGVTVIGDSIILGVEPYLKPLIPNVRIDGKVGRQFSELAGLVRKLQESNELQNTVVIELGTNGLVTEKQLSSVMEALGNRRVYMINVRVSQPWQDAVNEALDEAAEKYANIKVLDWYGQSAKRTSFFGADGVHLTATGAQYYAEMIRNRLFPNSDR